jgi:hypothetical protein
LRRQSKRDHSKGIKECTRKSCWSICIWPTIVAATHPLNRTQADELFDHCDPDGNGYITLKGFEVIAIILCINISYAMLLALGALFNLMTHSGGKMLQTLYRLYIIQSIRCVDPLSMGCVKNQWLGTANQISRAPRFLSIHHLDLLVMAVLLYRMTRQ